MARILVAGGGPAGCAFAVVARRVGHDVVLLDDGRRPASWPGESIPAGGGELIESVFGTGVLAGSAHAYGTTAAWGSDELEAHDYMAHWSGHGWHLDRSHFDIAIRDVAREHGVEVVHERVSSVGGTPGAWVVNGRQADWLIDATGRAGAIAGRLGSSTTRLDDQVALIRVIADLGGERRTTVESTPDGWWYTTPLPDGSRVVALITDADLVDADRLATWRRCLSVTRHISAIAGASLLDDGDARLFPAGTAHRQPAYGDHWLAIGDAAVCFDPLSSQGLITGIVMAARAAVTLEGSLEQWWADYTSVLEEHLDMRNLMVGAETRWPDSAFWGRRRLSGVAVVAGLVGGLDVSAGDAHAGFGT
jgi:flavin-dependent dehydrogenase